MSDNNLYLQVREKEGRLYSDVALQNLPNISFNHPLKKEWNARSASAKRLIEYLSHKNNSIKVLDIGCGNGWLSNQLHNARHEVIGIDQNLFELRQAARVFLNPKLHFIETDIFFAPFSASSFDVILLASVIQYFPSLPALVNTLFHYLKPQGEIHIIDSPLYANNEIINAQERTQNYYASLGFPEMAEYYFHHRLSELDLFSVKNLYQPNSLKQNIRKLLGKIDSPFPWFVIQK